MPGEIRFKKQYKPIGFPRHGRRRHRNAMAEAAETRRYNRMMKEREAEDAAKRGAWLSKLVGFFGLGPRSRRY